METRLENVFHIRCRLAECDADSNRIGLVANVLYAYDQTWRAKSVDIVIGSHAAWWKSEKAEEAASAAAVAKEDLALIKKWAARS